MKKVVFFFICIFSIQTIVVKCIRIDLPKCMIYNEKYFEFMSIRGYYIQLSDFFGIFSNSEHFTRGILMSSINALTNRKEKIDLEKDLPEAVWMLVPVPKHNDTFYILNLKYYDFLYADEPEYYIFSWTTGKRFVRTGKINTPNMTDTTYMWKIEQIGKADNHYKIKNVKYGEYLSPKLEKRVSSSKIFVYTWNKASSYDDYVWTFKCL